MTEWSAEPFSPLGWAECSRCSVGRALVVEAYADRARCGVCLAAENVAAPLSTAGVGPVVGWRIGGRSPLVETERAHHPRPEWISRSPLPDGWSHPSGVAALVALAESLGWRTRVQYSRGNGLHSRTSAPLGLSHFVAVRIGHHSMSDRSAYALYRSPVDKTSWTWASFWVWGPDLPPSQFNTLAELKTWLVDSVMPKDVWGAR